MSSVLSVVKGLVFVQPPTDEELIDIADMMIADDIAISAEFYKEQLGTIFESESCVICLEDDTTPDSIFYACGHKCCHFDCSNSIPVCPMCRLTITAKIRA